MSIGKRIKLARTHAGLTQAELGKRLDVPYQSIGQWENDIRNPKVETIQRIAAALDVPPGELLGTVLQPDREYEKIVDLLSDLGLSMEPTGFGEGPDESGDHFYIWHTDSEQPQEDRVEVVYRDLADLMERVKRDAEAHKMGYLQKRLDTELFY